MVMMHGQRVASLMVMVSHHYLAGDLWLRAQIRHGIRLLTTGAMVTCDLRSADALSCASVVKVWSSPLDIASLDISRDGRMGHSAPCRAE